MSMIWPLCAALVAGCGSTVENTGSNADQSGLSAPTGVTNPTNAGGAPTTGEVQNPGATGQAATAGNNTTAAQQSGGVQASQSLTQQVRAGTGPVTVKVGVVYLKGLDQAYKAASGGKSASTDSQGDYATVIAAINARPGSRLKLAPTYYAVDASSTTSQADQQQSACAYFTSDKHVDVVLSYTAGSNGALATCLQQHHIPIVDGFPTAETGAGTFAKLAGLWAPSQLSLDRLGALEPTYLVHNHWVDKQWPASPNCAMVTTPRIGVVTFDRPDWRAMYDHVVAPTFKSLGHPVHDAIFIQVSGSTGQQVAQASSAAQNAVLKFSSECIDHVAFISNVVVDYLFMNVAAQQGYTPRYGLSSLEGPPTILQNLPTSAASQLHGSMGPGWAPYADVSIADFDAPAKAPGAACVQVLTKGGHAPTDNNSATLAMPSCDGPMFVAAVFDRWIASGGNASLLSIVNGLGSSYRPAGTFSASYNDRRHDGAVAYRGFSFVDACTCFRYNSGLASVT
jgi:hypothetical protein